MPVKELENFRRKYPQYNDLDDLTLATKLAAKYPQYSDLVEKVKRTTEKISPSTLLPKPKSSGFGLIGPIPKPPDLPQETVPRQVFERKKVGFGLIGPIDIPEFKEQKPEIKLKPEKVEEKIRAYEPSFYEKRIKPVLRKIGLLQTPEEIQAKAQNVVAEAKELSKKTGMPFKKAVSFIDKNWDEYIHQKYGLLTPKKANERMMQLLIGTGVGAGLFTAPLRTLAGIATFAGAKEIAGRTLYPAIQYLEHIITKKPYHYKVIRNVEELLPEEATDAAKDLINFIELIGLGAIAGGVMRRAPQLAEKLTKKTLINYKLPQKFYLSPQKLKNLSEAELKNLLVRDLGLKANQIRTALKSGVEIEIPASKVVRIIDRPYWAKIKSFFRIKPSELVKIETKPPSGKIKPLALPKPEKVKIEAKPPTVEVAVFKKPSKIKTLIGLVRDLGGIDPEKAKLAGYPFETFKQFGLLSVLKKGGQGIDEIAGELVNMGELAVEEGESPSDALLDALKSKRKRIEYIEKEAERLIQEEEEDVDKLEKIIQKGEATPDQIYRFIDAKILSKTPEEADKLFKTKKFLDIEEAQQFIDSIESKKGVSFTEFDDEENLIVKYLLPEDVITFLEKTPSKEILGLKAKIWGVEMPAEPQTSKTINKTEILKWAEKAFKVPIRGKVTHKFKLAGVYYPGEVLIRLRKWGELEPLVHEIAHHIDFKMRKTLGKYWKQKLAPLGERRKLISELASLDYEFPKKRRIKEGFAEFVRYYLTTDKAKEKAPLFYKFFTETFLKEQPEIAANLSILRNMLEIWQKQGAENRVLGQIDFKGEHTKIKEVKDKIQKMKDWFGKNFINEFYLIRKIEDQMGIKPGVNIRPTKDPFTMATYMKSKAGMIARTFVMEKAVDEYGRVIGKGLVEILKPIPNKQMKSFIAYGVAKRALNLTKRGIESGVDIDDAKYLVEKYKNDVWDKVLEELTEWSNHLLDWIVRAGGLGEKEAQLIRNLNPIYLPFKRAFVDEIAVVKGIGGYVNRGQVVKKIKGSGRAILNPIEAMIAQATEMIAKAHKIRLASLMADLAEKEGVGGFITEVPAPLEIKKVPVRNIKEFVEFLKASGYETADIDMDKILTVFTQGWQYRGKDNIVSIWRNGKRKFYELHPDLYRAISGVDILRMPKVIRVLFSPFARLLRLGATGLKISFGLARNPFRDAFTYAVFSKNKTAIPIWDTGKGIYKEIKAKPGALIWRFKRMGGALSGMMGFDRAATMALYDEVLNEKLGKIGKVLKVVKHPVDTSRNILSFPELAPRSIELEKMYEKYKKEHPDWDEEDWFVAAFNDAQDVTINFTTSGYYAKRINEITAFFNVAIRGPEKLYRSLKERPFQTIVKGILWVTLFALWNYFTNKDKKWYKNLPPAFKYSNFFFELPDGKTILRLPVPFELGMLFGSAPIAALDYLETKDPQYLKGLRELIMRQNPFSLEGLTPSVIGPVIDVWRNTNYWGGKIETAGMQYLPPTERKRVYTTQFAISLSKAFNKLGMSVSPVQIDYLLDSYTGGWIRQLPIRPAVEPADIPIIGDLLLRMPKQPRRQLNNFFDEWERLAQRKQARILTPEERRRFYRIRPFYYRYIRYYSKLLKKYGEEKNIEKIERLFEKIREDLEKIGFK